MQRFLIMGEVWVLCFPGCALSACLQAWSQLSPERPSCQAVHWALLEPVMISERGLPDPQQGSTMFVELLS
jgi:hypothetical protein